MPGSTAIDQPKFGVGTCPKCKKIFTKKRRIQRFCNVNCHHRFQHNKYRWLVTRVTTGADGSGFAFSVSENRAAPLGGYFLASLTGFVRFPAKLVISEIKRRRLQKPLRKQVAQIVATGDPRFYPATNPEPQEHAAVEVAAIAIIPTTREVRRYFCPTCDVRCAVIRTAGPVAFVCPQCAGLFDFEHVVKRMVSEPPQKIEEISESNQNREQTA